MAGPCVENGDCIDMSFADPNVRADLVLSPDCDNGAECRPNGLWVPSNKASFVLSSANNTLNTPIAPGVSDTGFGVLIELDAYAYFGGPLASNYSVTKVDTITYKNTSCTNQIIRFSSSMPQTTYRCAGGWDVTLGLSTSGSGCALIPLFSSLRLGSGFYTGWGSTHRAFTSPDGIVPAGVTIPPAEWGSIGVIQPGETFSYSRRMYLRVDRRGEAVANPSNEISTFLGPSSTIQVWTQR